MTPERSPPASRIAGAAYSPCDSGLRPRRQIAFDDLAVGRDDLAGLDDDDLSPTLRSVETVLRWPSGLEQMDIAG